VDRLVIGGQVKNREEINMKSLLTALFLSAPLIVVSAGSASSQDGTIFYDVCDSNAQTYVDFQRETISVKTFSSDSLVFVSGGVKYFANKAPGHDFLEGGKDDTHFYAYRVDENSFFIADPSMTAFGYYHADKRKGDEADNKKRCSVDALNTFESMAKPYGAKQKDQRNDDYEVRTKVVTTEYVKNLRSQRVDPTLERDIMKWWKGPDPTKIPDPVLKIYFIMDDYWYTRNDYGTVLRKTIDALILWKERTGTKCWIQWRSFGYESLGPGIFDKNMNMWTKNAYLTLPEYRKIQAGAWSEVDCTPFVKSGI
jgi:hypothetical protein